VLKSRKCVFQMSQTEKGPVENDPQWVDTVRLTADDQMTNHDPTVQIRTVAILSVPNLLTLTSASSPCT
jgi:hypothetical protein